MEVGDHQVTPKKPRPYSLDDVMNVLAGVKKDTSNILTRMDKMEKTVTEQGAMISLEQTVKEQTQQLSEQAKQIAFLQRENDRSKIEAKRQYLVNHGLKELEKDPQGLRDSWKFLNQCFETRQHHFWQCRLTARLTTPDQGPCRFSSNGQAKEIKSSRRQGHWESKAST